VRSLPSLRLGPPPPETPGCSLCWWCACARWSWVHACRNPDLDGPFTPNVLNTVIFLVTLTMQVSTFAVNYQVRLRSPATDCPCAVGAHSPPRAPRNTSPPPHKRRRDCGVCVWLGAQSVQGHPYMLSLWEHKYLWRTLAGLYLGAFLLASELVRARPVGRSDGPEIAAAFGVHPCRDPLQDLPSFPLPSTRTQPTRPFIPFDISSLCPSESPLVGWGVVLCVRRCCYYCFHCCFPQVPDLGESLDLVPLPTEEVRVGVLSCMALDLVAVVVVERSIRWVASRLQK
jgi:hypothetical protein